MKLVSMLGACSALVIRPELGIGASSCSRVSAGNIVMMPQLRLDRNTAPIAIAFTLLMANPLSVQAQLPSPLATAVERSATLLSELDDADGSATQVSASASSAQDAPVPAAAAARDITYTDLLNLLTQCLDGDCSVESVLFTDAKGEVGEAVVNGARLQIVGIPRDNPNNDTGPAKLIAKIRYAKVPYSFSFAANLRSAKPAAPSTPVISLPSFPKIF